MADSHSVTMFILQIVKHKTDNNQLNHIFVTEICLLTNQRRVASVYAVTNCCLYSLHADDFNELLPRYPVMKQTLETVAASRLSKLGW